MRPFLPWLLPLFFLLLFTPFSSCLDMQISAYFYENGHFFENRATYLFYQYGEWPAFITAGIAGFLLLFSLFIPRLKKWRGGMLTLFLTLIIGAGILINSVFKEYWARPRPKQIEAFGGPYAFQPFYAPKLRSTNNEESQKSFPSGHAAMGFYFIALILVGRRYRNGWILGAGIFLTLFMGLGLMFTRIAQGGHFFSDTVASLCIMWWVAYTIDWATAKLFRPHL